jgi:hypothetical protein
MRKTFPARLALLVAIFQVTLILPQCGSAFPRNQRSFKSSSKLAITSTSLPPGKEGSTYQADLKASGGVWPYKWSVAAGILPKGLSLQSSTGTLSGTPTTTGTYGVMFAVADNTGDVSTQTLSVTIDTTSALTIVTTNLPGATINKSYSASLQASGGTTPYAWSVKAGTLPPGLSLSSGGVISGTPTKTGAYAATFGISDTTNQTASQSLSITVGSTTLQILTTSLPDGTLNKSYSAQLQASGGGTPYSWLLVGGALPSGIALSTSGAISGTPTKDGDYSATFQVTDSTLNSPQVAMQNLTISIAPAPSSSTLCPEMQHGAYYNSGYSLWDNVVGRSDHRVHFLRFKPSKSGYVDSVKWYNSSGSHAVWDACTKYYGSINPCANHGGQPQYMNTQDPEYPLAFPNGWWPYAQACSTSYSGCYSGGTGGVASFTLMDGSGTVLATAEAKQPNVKYGFYSTFPVISLSQSAYLTAGNYYYLKIADTDSDQSANWWSADSYTPYNTFTAVQANAQNLVVTALGGKSNVSDAIFQSSLGGSLESDYQPIFAFGYTDGSCVTQGFAP